VLTESTRRFEISEPELLEAVRTQNRLQDTAKTLRDLILLLIADVSDPQLSPLRLADVWDEFSELERQLDTQCERLIRITQRPS
jgi:hypothetical protein